MGSRLFSSGRTPDEKKQIQDRFLNGDLFVIVATNAFGMGVDKPDVRVVIHADIPGSIENYLQEAGRAGRDRNPAHVYCYIMKMIWKHNLSYAHMASLNGQI